MNKYLQYTLIVFAFLLVGWIIYANTLSAQFVLDSEPRIENNRFLRISSLTLSSLSKAVFNAKASKNRPVPNLSFALNYYFDQYAVKYYHVVNILLHIATGILLFFLYESLLSIAGPDPDARNGNLIAFFAALLWLVHPVHTQSVTYIVQRSNIMAALFGITSFLLYIYGRKSQSAIRKTVFWITAAIAFLLALGSKQNAAILPFIVCLGEWYFFQDLSKAWLKNNLKYFCGALLIFGLIAFIYLSPDPLARLSSMRDFSEGRFTLTERVLTQFRVVVYYLSLFFYPHPSRLNLDYDFPLSHSLFDPVTTLLSGILLIGLITTGILTAKKHRLVSFCIFWYFLNLAIESSVIPLAIIFEHRTYMPLMGLALLTVLYVDRYLKLFWPKAVLLGLMVAVSALWTYQRNETWKDPEILWQDVVSKSPSKARPHNNLGRVLHKNGKDNAAIEHFKAALKIEPHHQNVLNNLGIVLVDQNKTIEAIAYLKTALEHNPKKKETLNNLGRALDKQKKPDEAIARFKAALQIDPEFPDALNNIGAILKDQNRDVEAVAYFEAAVKSNPYFVEALNNLGLARLDQGKTTQAIQYFREALEVDPVYTDALKNLGAAFINQGNPEAAARHFKAALKIDPGHVAALNHLGLVHISEGDISKGLKLFTHALRLAPDNAETHVNLGAAYLKLEQFETAISHLETALKLDPEMAQAHTNLGIGLLQHGAFPEGFFHLKRARELDPDDEKARANLSRALIIKQQIENSIGTLLKAADTDPSNPRIYADLANLYQSIGDDASAVEALNKALAMQPASDTLLNSLGNLYLANRQYGQALKIFEKHLSLDPGFSLPYYNMARWHAKQNQITEAVNWLEKAISRGYANWEQIKSDADLDNVRNTIEYEKLLNGR